MRLNRFLAASGLGSRRSCEELIRQHRVEINGESVTDLATLVAESDEVRVDGKPVRPVAPLYYLLHKPRGVVCTAADPQGRPTIFNLLPEDLPRLFHVGRLDADSQGLLLVTNDGELAQAMTHPRHAVEKEYHVTVSPPFRPGDEARLLRGTMLEGRPARMEKVRLLKPNLLSVILKQGLNRQIRLMLAECGYKVRKLKRIRIGPLTLERLQSGAFRKLKPGEIKALRRAARKS